MTQSSLPWDGVLLGDAADAPYSAAEWALQWALRHNTGALYPNYGVFGGSGSSAALAVLQTSPASVNVEVQTGAALIDGRFYRNSAAESLAVAANASGNPRVDTVILRLDYVAQTVRLVIKQGTPAASPVRPSLQQDATYWEIPLADIAVANGFATILQANISQRQRYVNYSTAGWQPFAVPIAFTPVGTFNTPISMPANGGSIQIPIPVTGNLLLDQVAVYVLTTGVNYNIGWGIYVQDNQDISVTAYNTLRRIANGSASGVLGGAAAVYNIASAVNQILLSPGLYWLVVQNQHAANAFNLGSQAPSSFTQTTARTKTTANPNGATLDLSAAGGGWTTQTGAIGAWLKGMVFGDATSY